MNCNLLCYSGLKRKRFLGKNNFLLDLCKKMRDNLCVS